MDPFHGTLVVAAILVLFLVFVALPLVFLRHFFFFSAGSVPEAPAPRGVAQDLLDSLPVTVYRAEDHVGVLECAVCLAGLQDGEHARFLPRCGHGFHAGCVDVWLASRSTCPLCRVTVAGNGKPAAYGSPSQQRKQGAQVGADHCPGDGELDLRDLPLDVVEEGLVEPRRSLPISISISRASPLSASSCQVSAQLRPCSADEMNMDYLALLAAALLLLLDLEVEGGARVGGVVEAAPELEPRDVARPGGQMPSGSRGVPVSVGRTTPAAIKHW
ncbi:hypothetical protein ZWY2020_031333 [Hordeum vulgare]|nr:hypothetical protein ZWY2020_031333 [Hordeum vulgare]